MLVDARACHICYKATCSSAARLSRCKDERHDPTLHAVSAAGGGQLQSRNSRTRPRDQPATKMTPIIKQGISANR